MFTKRQSYPEIRNLHLLISQNPDNPEIVDQFIQEYQVDPKQCYGHTNVLHQAILAEASPIVNLLLQKYSMCPNQMRFSDTPIALATRKGDIRSVKILLEYKANLNYASGKNALYWAIKGSHTEIALLLIQAGAPLNHPYKNKTPLHQSLLAGNNEIAKYLIKAGADVNAPCIDATPLHWAIYLDNQQIADQLIQAWADLTLLHGGLTPLDLATSYQREHIIQLLENEEAPRECSITQDSISSSNQFYLESAKSAIHLVRELEIHANNFPGSPLTGPYAHCGLNQLLKQKQEQENAFGDNLIRSNARFSKRHKAGNCLAQAEVAYIFLKEELNIRKVDMVYIKNGDHMFVVLGRKDNSDKKRPHTWGDNAIICDPWANKFYPLSQFEQHLMNFLNPRTPLEPWDTQRFKLKIYSEPDRIKLPSLDKLNRLLGSTEHETYQAFKDYYAEKKDFTPLQKIAKLEQIESLLTNHRRSYKLQACSRKTAQVKNYYKQRNGIE